MKPMGSDARVLLVVDDDPDDAFFVKKAFGAVCPSVRLESVTDGEQAVAYLEGRGEFADRAVHPLPSHVLLDLKLPLRNGIEVLSWIRARAELKELPVTILSGSELPGDMDQTRGLGISGYIAKPVSFPEFLEAVRKFCQANGLL